MATKKAAKRAKDKGKNKGKKQYLLRTLRIKKGFKTVTAFGEEVAKELGRSTPKEIKTVQSMLSRYELGNRPASEYLGAIQSVLKLTKNEIISLNKSIARTAKKTPAAKRKAAQKVAAKGSVVAKTVATKSEIITPDAAVKFSNAVTALGGASLERAKQILEDLATK